ncbi:hypothetical protein [Gemmata sp.]|uniref:hypothetical protein n=1 Tax=Gemmata sp. TaxID=1914242 RepID=UPI003F6F86D6
MRPEGHRAAGHEQAPHALDDPPDRGPVRLAAVQVWFAGGAHRDYLVARHAGHGSQSSKRPPRWWVRSFADAGADLGLDLRDRADAKKLDRLLARVDPDQLGG